MLLTHKDLSRIESANACRPSAVTREDVTALIQSADMAIRLREVLKRIAEGNVPPDEHGHYLAHRAAVNEARAALKETL